MTETTNISERAMLVSLNISQWTNSLLDKTVTNEVVRSKNATSDAGAWRTKLLPKDAMKGVQQKANVLRQAHMQLTLPWNDGGTRILPSALFDRYTESIDKAKQQFSEAVDEFLSRYPIYLEAAPARLGELDSTVNMPTADEIRGKFGVESTILPMPRVDDFRVNLGGDSKRVRAKVEESIAAMTDKAVTSLWTQLTEMLERIEKTLGKKDKIFRDSLIGNLQDFISALPALNITNDSRLEAFRVECQDKLAKLKPDSLRKQPRTRAKAADAAKHILESIRKIDLDIE